MDLYRKSAPEQVVALDAGKGETPAPRDAAAGSLQLENVSKIYGSEQALYPTSLKVRNGEFLTILGPSGSGKTTILRLIGGFTHTSSGRIVLDGKEITRLPPNKRPCNTVFQDYALFPHKTAVANVGYGLMVRGHPKKEIARKVTDALRLVGLEAMARKYPDQLSGGQQQRVALARSLVCQPRVLLLDEPLSALDADMRHQMQLFLKKIQRDIRTTFIFVTHDQEEAITMSDRIAVMSEGRIEQVGTPYEVYHKPDTYFVATFLGDNNIMGADVLDNGAVDLPFGRVAPSGPVPVTEKRLFAAVRPERIELSHTPQPAKVNVRARVVDVSFSGAMTMVRVVPDEVPDHSLLVKVTSGRGIENLCSGASVIAVFDPVDLSFFTAEPS